MAAGSSAPAQEDASALPAGIISSGTSPSVAAVGLEASLGQGCEFCVWEPERSYNGAARECAALTLSR